VYDGTRLPFLACGPLGSRNGGSYQLANTGRVQIGRLRDADVADNLAFATQQTIRIGQMRAEVEAEVDPIGMRSGEYERIARARRKREVVGDGVHLVDELVGFRSLFEDCSSRGQGEPLDDVGVGQQEFEVLRVGRTCAHGFIVSHSRLSLRPYNRDPVVKGLDERLWREQAKLA